MVLSRKEVGMLIKEARKYKSKIAGEKYTQQMLADDLEISRGYLGDIENGRTYPNYVLLNKIAEACEVPFDFFGEAEDSVFQDLVLRIKEITSDMVSLEEGKRALKIDEALSELKKLNKYKKNANFLPQIKFLKAEAIKDPQLRKIIQNSEELDFLKDILFQNEVEKPETIEFTSAEEAIKFILQQPAIMGYGGFDIDKMSSEEVIEFANELLRQLKLLSYKYKK